MTTVLRAHGPDDVIDALRRVPLRGYPDARPYEYASIYIMRIEPDWLIPTQRYVLTGGVQQALELRAELAPQGFDPFALPGRLDLRFSDSSEAPLIPPIIENTLEPDGVTRMIVADGMHRIYAARKLGVPITVVMIDGVLGYYPYYALGLPNGWADVLEFEDLPDGFQKKTYRNPEGYKALFRQYNAVFPGVQVQRKRTNPDHLQR